LSFIKKGEIIVNTRAWIHQQL